MYKYILIFSFSTLFSQYNYNLEDLNSTSDFYQDIIGTSYFSNQVTLHYFGHYN